MSKPSRADRLTKTSPFLIQTINSNSVPIWGSNFQFDVKLNSMDINELILSLQLPAITGVTGGSGAYYCPPELMYNYCEISFTGGQIAQYIYSDSNFILNQCFNTDEKRKLLNSYNDYASSGVASRITRSGASNWWHISLRSLFNETNMTQLTSGHHFTVKFFMNNLADCVNLNGGTGTPVSVITSAQLIIRVSKNTDAQVQEMTKYLFKQNSNLMYHDTKYSRFAVPSGATTSTHILGGFTSAIDTIFFIVRPDSGLTNDTQMTFLEINNFALLDNGGQNMIGGNVISSTLSLTQFSKWWVTSSYLAEAYGGTSGSFVYMFSWSASPAESLATGAPLGAKIFTGFESLVISYKTALGASHSVDVYGMQHNCLVQNLGGVVKQTNFN